LGNVLLALQISLALRQFLKVMAVHEAHSRWGGVTLLHLNDLLSAETLRWWSFLGNELLYDADGYFVDKEEDIEV
jgi:hypothetical protein